MYNLRGNPRWHGALRTLQRRVGVGVAPQHTPPWRALHRRAKRLRNARYRAGAALLLGTGQRYRTIQLAKASSLVRLPGMLVFVERHDKVDHTGAPRRYPVTEPWCRRVLAPYAVTPERAAALEREYPDIERQPALIPLPRRWPARETGIYARAARRAVIDTLLAKGASEGEAAAYIGHSVRAQRSHYRTHPTPGECAMAERLRAAAR